MDTEYMKFLYKNFRELTIADKKILETFSEHTEFVDRTFSSLYTWQKHFRYAYKQYGDIVAILSIGKNKQISVILFYKNDADISDVMLELYELFQKAKIPLCFEYIAEQEIAVYQKSIEKIGKQMLYYANPNESDYIYLTKEFLCLDGKENRGKRSGLNSIARNYPNIIMKTHSRKNDLTKDCYKIFEQWCKSYVCDNCFYGCEKKAFQRFMEVYEERKHTICVAYSDETPLSFAVSEKINPDMVCYCFQKNASKIRGLTYWLNREMALKDEDVKYINLGEDMGISGIRTDKNSFHPYCKKEKYRITIQ